MPCMRFWQERRRRSLRGRLAFAFVLVAFFTVTVVLVALTHGLLGPGPGRFSHVRVLFLALPAAGFAGALTAGLITRRLSRLRAAVERLDLRDLSLRVPVEGDDEIAVLARAFNHTVSRLEAEERARRELFADVAHELRHPLAVLTSRLEMMQDGLVPLDDEQLLHLQDTAMALTRLVGDLRDLSLAEVGRLTLNRAPLEVGELIADLTEYMEPLAADKEIRLVADVAPGLPAVDADADRIRQVLVNLLANALHYTPEGGRVEVAARAGAGSVIITVSDTGAGIAPEDLPHVFDRFYRADKSRTRSTGGSGLGLAIVRSLVDLHGGSVRVGSRLGEGTRFTVSLPSG